MSIACLDEGLSGVHTDYPDYRVLIFHRTTPCRVLVAAHMLGGAEDVQQRLALFIGGRFRFHRGLYLEVDELTDSL